MDVVGDIRCKGCGESGQVVWRETRWHPDVQPQRTPLRVSGRFSILEHGAARIIACGRCQQIHNHG